MGSLLWSSVEPPPGVPLPFPWPPRAASAEVSVRKRAALMAPTESMSDRLRRTENSGFVTDSPLPVEALPRSPAGRPIYGDPDEKAP